MMKLCKLPIESPASGSSTLLVRAAHYIWPFPFTSLHFSFVFKSVKNLFVWNRMLQKKKNSNSSQTNPQEACFCPVHRPYIHPHRDSCNHSSWRPIKNTSGRQPEIHYSPGLPLNLFKSNTEPAGSFADNKTLERTVSCCNRFSRYKNDWKIFFFYHRQANSFVCVGKIYNLVCFWPCQKPCIKEYDPGSHFI